MKFVAFAQKYGKYVAVLVVGLVVGGFTMQMASASIPDSSGAIHGCRNNITTMLRVIDSASASCGADETGLNWDQNGVKGYATVRYSAGTFILDSNHSKNVSNLVVGPNNSDNFPEGLCLTLNTTPRSISMIANGVSNYPLVSIKDENGWSHGDYCASVSSSANIGVLLSNETPSLTLTLF